jgi:hypothetical protein
MEYNGNSIKVIIDTGSQLNIVSDSVSCTCSTVQRLIQHSSIFTFEVCDTSNEVKQLFIQMFFIHVIISQLKMKNSRRCMVVKKRLPSILSSAQNYEFYETLKNHEDLIQGVADAQKGGKQMFVALFEPDSGCTHYCYMICKY